VSSRPRAGERPQAAGELRFGIALSSGDPIRTRTQLDGMCRAVSRVTGLTLLPVTHWHYHRLLEALANAEIDLAWLPPILALRAAGRGRLLPIALCVRNGVASYGSALFCRPEAPFHSLSDLRGVRAAWVDRQSAAGYLIIRAAMRAQGVDPDQAFSADQFLGAHDAVARAVLDGEAEVGATFVHLDPPGASDLNRAKITRAGWGGARARILALAGPIPSDMIAAHNRVAISLIGKIQRALIEDMAPDVRSAVKALMGAEGFLRPTGEHLLPLTRLLSGLDAEPTSDARPVRLPPYE
jgi:phosphonate transport system substrate-binding protein